MITISPPFFATWLLERMLDANVKYAALGDFEEQFHYIVSKHGLTRAKLFYWSQLLLLLPSFLYTFVYWSLVMFKNFIKVTLRAIQRNKVFSFINISGLAIGMACSILILLYVHYEYSFDRFHEHTPNLFRVIVANNQTFQGKNEVNGTPGPLAATMKADFPEVKAASRISEGSGWIRFEDKHFFEDRFYFADPDFLNMYSFTLLRGNNDLALSDPFSVLITEDTALKYFSNADPIGKTLTMEDEWDYVSSSPGEFHPQALTEPDVNLSAHPAPIVQSQVESQSASVQTAAGHVGQFCQTNEPRDACGDGVVCICGVPSKRVIAPDIAIPG